EAVPEVAVVVQAGQRIPGDQLGQQLDFDGMKRLHRDGASSIDRIVDPQNHFHCLSAGGAVVDHLGGYLAAEVTELLEQVLDPKPLLLPELAEMLGLEVGRVSW